MRIHLLPRAALGAALAMVLAASAALAQPMPVLVTNDDGVAAAGIDALVEELRDNPNLDVRVYAPAANQSGTGENLTATPITVTDTTTASGYAAKAVAGYPADAALYGILSGMAGTPPQLVVSGINFGQNVGDVTKLSGTVGAALAAARLGIPAIATSQGFGTPQTYDQQAQYLGRLIEKFRTNKGGLRKNMLVKGLPKGSPPRAYVLNVNFPLCTTGSLRGVRVVPLGRVATPTGYTLISSVGGVDSVQLVQQNNGIGSNDCISTLSTPLNDIEALSNGFAAVTPLDTDLTAVAVLKKFKIAQE